MLARTSVSQWKCWLEIADNGMEFVHHYQRFYWGVVRDVVANIFTGGGGGGADVIANISDYYNKAFFQKITAHLVKVLSIFEFISF